MKWMIASLCLLAFFQQGCDSDTFRARYRKAQAAEPRLPIQRFVLVSGQANVAFDTQTGQIGKTWDWQLLGKRATPDPITGAEPQRSLGEHSVQCRALYEDDKATLPVTPENLAQFDPAAKALWDANPQWKEHKVPQAPAQNSPAGPDPVMQQFKDRHLEWFPKKQTVRNDLQNLLTSPDFGQLQDQDKTEALRTFLAHEKDFPSDRKTQNEIIKSYLGHGAGWCQEPFHSAWRRGSYGHRVPAYEPYAGTIGADDLPDELPCTPDLDHFGAAYERVFIQL